MLLAAAMCALGLAAVLFALYRDEPLPAPRSALPDWDPLPTPSEVSHGEFPLVFLGYDPASVEVRFDLLRRAYDDLYAAASRDVLHRARRRAYLRAGRDVAEPEEAWEYDQHWIEDVEEPLEEPAPDEDNLRMEAVYASVDPVGEDEDEELPPRGDPHA
jgi:hypothetical protein